LKYQAFFLRFFISLLAKYVLPFDQIQQNSPKNKIIPHSTKNKIYFTDTTSDELWGFVLAFHSCSLTFYDPISANFPRRLFCLSAPIWSNTGEFIACRKTMNLSAGQPVSQLLLL